MAKRKGSEVDLLVGGAGVLATFWTALVSEVEKLGGTAKDLHRLVTPEGMNIIKMMAALIVRKGTKPVATVAQVTGDMITRVGLVDYTRTPQNAIKATGRVEYLNKSALETMPARGKGIQKVTVVFFEADQELSDDELAVLFANHGIEPDPYAVAAVNEADPVFADEYPNSTHWKVKGKWYFIAFGKSSGGRDVSVCSADDDFVGTLRWFGGVRK